MTLAERIQQLRKQHNLSQEQLADAIGVTRQAISKWETEQTTPDLTKIILLADYFQVSCDYLLKGTDPPHSDPITPATASTIPYLPLATLLNLSALILSLSLWYEYQRIFAYTVGLILCAAALLLYYLAATRTTPTPSSRWHYWLINTWLIIPILLCFLSLLSPFYFLGSFLASFSRFPYNVISCHLILILPTALLTLLLLHRHIYK